MYYEMGLPSSYDEWKTACCERYPNCSKCPNDENDEEFEENDNEEDEFEYCIEDEYLEPIEVKDNYGRTYLCCPTCGTDYILIDKPYTTCKCCGQNLNISKQYDNLYKEFLNSL